jgi:regulator of protease activity HflC (stomatin/prohibitin superfamily)
MKMRWMMMVIALVAMTGCVGCEYVEPGHVGLKVNLLGSDKGVDQQELGPGRYWIGMNERLYQFPMFEQNVSWTADKSDDGADESFTFQTKEGMAVNADFAMTYQIAPGKASLIFQKYRKGIAEVTDGPVRNYVRDALQEVSSTMTVEDMISGGKVGMVDQVEKLVREQVKDNGINVIKLSLLGRIRLPEQVVQALNAKIEATQRAQQRENELREAEAEAKKKVAAAEGQAAEQKALAEGEAAAILARAEAQAKANRLLAESLTPTLVELKKLERWDGHLPQFGGGSGGAVPVIHITPPATK